METNQAKQVMSIAEDMLKGADAIADFIGITSRRVYYLADRNELPVFRMGKTLCARRSTLLRHIVALENGIKESNAASGPMKYV